MTEPTKTHEDRAETFEDGEDAAREIIDAFTNLHPGVTLTWNEWQDLREIISLAWQGGDIDQFATDPLYLKHRRTAS